MLRKDRLTGAWAIGSRRRGQRPHDFLPDMPANCGVRTGAPEPQPEALRSEALRSEAPQSEAPQSEALRSEAPQSEALRSSRSPGPGNKESRPDCPFCPGNEQATPRELQRWEYEDLGWQLRAVPNAYGALEPTEGDQEVLIETPRHDGSWYDFSVEELTRLLLAYRERLRVLLQTNSWAVAFKNEGAAAGASLRHPHSQLVGLRQVPPLVRQRLQRARLFAQRAGQSLLSAELDLLDGRSGYEVARSDGWYAWVPEAPILPGALRIAGRSAARPPFRFVEQDARAAAMMLAHVLRLGGRYLSRPDFNLMLQIPPEDALEGEGSFWYIDWVPRGARPGGFELASGVLLSPLDATEYAAALRAQGAPWS